MNYHILHLSGRKPEDFIIKTEESAIDAETAIAAYNAVTGRHIRLSDEPEGRVEAFVDEPAGAAELTVRYRLPGGFVFYRKPGLTVPVTLICEPPEAPHTPKVVQAMVPAYLVSDDCTGLAIRQLFAQIVRDAWNEGSFKALRRPLKEIMYWDFIGLPADFLARYGVELAELDTYLTLRTGASEPVIK